MFPTKFTALDVVYNIQLQWRVWKYRYYLCTILCDIMLAYEIHINQVWPSDAIYCYRAMVLVIPLAWRYGNLHLITKFHLKTDSGAIPHNALKISILNYFKTQWLWNIGLWCSQCILRISSQSLAAWLCIWAKFYAIFSLGINCHLRLFTGCQSKWSGWYNKKRLDICHRTDIIQAQIKERFGGHFLWNAT